MNLKRGWGEWGLEGDKSIFHSCNRSHALRYQSTYYFPATVEESAEGAADCAGGVPFDSCIGKYRRDFPLVYFSPVS